MNQEELGELTALAEETIAGIRVVKGPRRRHGAVRALPRPLRPRGRATSLRVADVDAVFLPALEALPLVGILVVLWYGAHRVLSGDITIGTFALFNVYLVLLVFPLRTIGQRVSTVQRGAAAAGVSSTCSRLRRRSSRLPRHGSFPARSDVRFEDVRFAYGDERPILDGLSLDDPGGDRSRSSGRPARASRPSPRCSRASTTRTAAA